MNEIDDLNNIFNNCNISNDVDKNMYNYYFNIMIDKMKKNNIYIKCNCANNNVFLINQYCTTGIIHKITPNYDIIYNKNFLYYSYNDFIIKKPYFIK